jgi:hypothetical protein
LVWGAAAIARALDLYDADGVPDEAKVVWLASRGYLTSVKKKGRRLVAQIDELRREFVAEAVAKTPPP